MSSTLEGDVYDPFGGLEHLRTGKVIFVGDAEQRIREDILRILRFFRFFAHYGAGLPDKSALTACAKFAEDIVKLSPERIRQETFKLLESDRSADVWDLMMRAGVVTHFLPEATAVPVLSRLIALESRQHIHGEHGRAFVVRRLAAVLDLVRTSVPSVVKALRLSNEQAAQLAILSAPAWKISMDMSQRDVEHLVYRIGNDMVRSLLMLAAAREDRAQQLEPLYQTATAFRAPRFPLIGDDILKRGWKEGPDVGRILGEIVEWWLAEDFKPGRTECLKKLQDEYPPPPDNKPGWISG
jgi:poly(A) polymerase